MTPWEQAAEEAYALGAARPTEQEDVPASHALGRTLAAEVRSGRALPTFDNSAMDGWAVAGEAPWRQGAPVLAGDAPDGRVLQSGEARPIATGAPVPPGTLGILRAEAGIVDTVDGGTLVDTLGAPEPGQDIRLRGGEVDVGEVLLTTGEVVGPPALGLLAAAGVARVPVREPAVVDFLPIGDELSGAAGVPGRVPDALAPMMPALLGPYGAECSVRTPIPDRTGALLDALAAGTAATLVTSGGTAHGPADVVRPALDALGARILVDGMAVRPGGSVILAELPDGRALLALPGNPLAAVVGALLLAGPLLLGRLLRPLPT
uniref:molybdopterin-binding protein n=1 Tax=uncultured Leifsonia sp. TaxID=340359 RepID=UPI0028D0632B